MTDHPTAPRPAPFIGPGLVSIPAATLTGVEGRPIRVEVHHGIGVLPGFQLVGYEPGPRTGGGPGGAAQHAEAAAALGLRSSR